MIPATDLSDSAQRLFEGSNGATPEAASKPAPKPEKKKRAPAQGAVVRELLRAHGVADEHFNVTRDRRTGQYHVVFGHPAIEDKDHRGTNPAAWWAKRIRERFDCDIVETDDVVVCNPVRNAIISATVVLAAIPTPKAQPEMPVLALPARVPPESFLRHMRNATARQTLAGRDKGRCGPAWSFNTPIDGCTVSGDRFSYSPDASWNSTVWARAYKGKPVEKRKGK